MLFDTVHQLLPLPATAGEKWLYCYGMKDMLGASLRIHLRLLGGPSRGLESSYRASITLLDPCTFLEHWARLAVLIERRQRCGGLGPDAPEPPRPSTVPLAILLYARALETTAGDLAVQWCVPDAPPLVFHAEPSSGLVLPGEGPADVALSLPAVQPTVAGAMAENAGAAAAPPQLPPPPGAEHRAGMRRVTVGRTYRGEKTVPFLRLSGHWLGKLGFTEGVPISVSAGPGRIALDLLPVAGHRSTLTASPSAEPA